MKIAQILMAALVCSFLFCFGCGSTQEASPVADYTWNPAPRVQPSGVLGERLQLWREKRLWHVINDPFILDGFATPPGRHPWQGEHVGKWLHAATLAYEATGDSELGKRLDETVEQLIAAQDEDGYLGTYSPEQRFHAPPGEHTKKSWDIWTHRYNLYGLLTYENFHPNPAVVEACVRMGDLLIATYGPGQQDLTQTGTRQGISSATVLESVMMLYARTGEQRFLNFAEHLHQSMEANERLRVVSHLTSGGDVQGPGDGKAYQLMAVLLGYAELYRFTGKPEYLDAARAGWDSIRDHHTFETGGPWSYKQREGANRECFADESTFHPSNDVENCSTVTWIQLSLELLRLTGDARYAVEAERTTINHLWGAQSPNGIDWAYYTPPNCSRRDYKGELHCCGSSGPRALEMYARHLVGTAGGVVTINTYLPLGGEIEGAEPEGISIAGNYPFENRATLAFDLDSEAEFAVDFVRPSGVNALQVSIDGEMQELTTTPAGHFRLQRTWQPDETVELEFDYAVTPHQHMGRDGANWVTFTYGPLALAQEAEAPESEVAGVSMELVPLPEHPVSPAFQVAGSEITLIPYYLAGATGKPVQTLFPLPDASAP
jgi:uncharacterized protein